MITIKINLAEGKGPVKHFLPLFALWIGFMLVAQFLSISFLNILILTFLFAIMGLAWSLSAIGGQFSWGNAIFFGIGAYTTAMMLSMWQISPWISMLLGSIFAAAIGALSSLLSLRMEKAAFALMTFTIALLTQTLFINWPAAGGGSGLTLPVMPQSFYMMYFDSGLSYFYVIATLLLAEIIIIYVIRRSRMHLALTTISDDPVAAEARGINVAKHKVISFAISAALTATAGTFYVMFYRYLDPYVSFNFSVSAEIIIVSMLGGTNYLLGPILGSITYVYLSEYLRVWLVGSYQGLNLIVLSVLFAVVVIRSRGGLAELFTHSYHKIAAKLIHPKQNETKDYEKYKNLKS